MIEVLFLAGIILEALIFTILVTILVFIICTIIYNRFFEKDSLEDVVVCLNCGYRDIGFQCVKCPKCGRHTMSFLKQRPIMGVA